MPYADPGEIFASTARHYAVRPGYPAALLDFVRCLVPGDGIRVLDLGTGPGVVAIGLARRGVQVVGVDPSEEMLTQARRQAAKHGVTGIDWLCGVAEDLPRVGAVDAAVIGDAFHWMKRSTVLDALDRVIRPGGCLALLSHRWTGWPKPSWARAVEKVRVRHLGHKRHAGPTGQYAEPERGSHEDVVRGSAFNQVIMTRADYEIDVTLDELVTWQLSQAHTSEAVLGQARHAYEADLRAVLHGLQPSGRFTERSVAHLLVGRRPSDVR